MSGWGKSLSGKPNEVTPKVVDVRFVNFEEVVMMIRSTISGICILKLL